MAVCSAAQVRSEQGQDESWATLKTRFESPLTELATLGVTKMDHQRKGRH